VSGFWSYQRLLAGAAVISLATGATCLVAQTKPSTAPATTAPAAVSADPSAPVALINGNPVNPVFFHETLVQVAGMRVFQQVLDLSLVQNACRGAGLELSGPTFQKRMDDEMQRTLDSLTVPPETTREQRLAILNNALAQRGVTAIEFRMLLETNSGLRALAKGAEAQGSITVSDTDIDTQWKADFGKKYRIHVIAVNNDAEIAAKVRDLIEKQKKTPEQAAQDQKLPNPGEWVIPDNAMGAGIVLTACQALKEGQLSPLTEVPGANGQPAQKVLILLDKIEADTTTTTNKLTDKLKMELKQKVMNTKEEQWMNAHKAMLRQGANIQINDPELSRQFEVIAKTLQAQAEAAKTQPGVAVPVPAGGGGVGGVPATGPSLPPMPSQLPPAGK
jgi:hypothetical protein